MNDLIVCRKCLANVPPGRFCAECGAEIGLQDKREDQIDDGARRTPSATANLMSEIEWIDRRSIGSRRHGSYGHTLEPGKNRLIRTAGSRTEELAAYFINRIRLKDLPGIAIFKTRLNMAEGLYIVVQRTMEETGEANMLVRFHKQGSDALLGWHGTVLPPRTSVWPKNWFRILVVILCVLLAANILDLPGNAQGLLWGAFSVTCGVLGYTALMRCLGSRKNGFQYRISYTQAGDLAVSVDAALEEAIDDARLTNQVQLLEPKESRIV